MFNKFNLIIIFISLQVWANNNTYVTHKKLVLQPDSPYSNRLDFKITETRIDGHLVTRSLPILDGIEVEGADGVFTPDSPMSSHYSYFDFPSAQFNINAAEALEKALSYTNSLLLNPYVEKITNSYERIWLMHFGELRPAYKTRPPTLLLNDLQDIYIDGENGEVLKIEPSAQFLQAPSSLFVYSPSPEKLSDADLKPVMLTNLVSLSENDFLRGEYISVRNCCHHFTCPKEGPCNDSNKRCALSSHENAQQSFELIQLPTDTLGLDPLMSLPKNISVNAVRCTYLPYAKASYKSPHNNILGFFEQPIDEPYGLASEMDRFSEVQAYNSVMTFFNHIRFLLNNPNWCLREVAMSCDENGKTLKDEHGNPINPYRVFVNQMVPDMKMDGGTSDDPESFIAQIQSGRGTNDNPVVLKSLTRMGNAAFIPAMSTLKTNTPRADEILSDLIKPYDHNVFFQGDRDFAYDGDIVFHEFMHAVTTSLVNKLNTMGINQWGIHSEPGSLNEGWSDYFAAAFSNKPAIGSYAAIRDGYGEAALRNVANNFRCPNDVIGEIHNDGLVWSGALWQIREEIGKRGGLDAQIEFDRAVLTALAQAKTTEDFKNQSQKLIESIKSRASLGPKIAELSQKILQERGIANCFRAYQLSQVDKNNNLKINPKNILFVPSKNQIGLKNYAPSSSQLALDIPAGTKSLKVSWRQYLGGTGALLGTETTPDNTGNIIPLGVVASFDEPILWHFSSAKAQPKRKDGEINHISKALFNNGQWEYTQEINLDNCTQRKLYLSLLSNDFKYILKDIKVDFEINNKPSDCSFVMHEAGDPEYKGPACAQSSNHQGLLILALLWALYVRRRHSAVSK